MDLDTGAGLLHRVTSYRPGIDWDAPFDHPLAMTAPASDLATVPPQVKSYAGDLRVVALPRDLPDPGVPALAALAGTAAPSLPLDAAHLGRLLFLTAGVVRTREWQGRPFLFRAAGSAGGRFPLEVYVSARGVAGVPDGLHWYDATAHALVQVGPPAGGEATTVVVTAVPWRSAWKYAERAFRHVFWDAGTALSQLQVAAASAGWEPRVRSLFPDAQVRELVGADGVHEHPVVLLALGDGAPAIEPGGPALQGSLPEVELPLVTGAFVAGHRSELGDPWADGPVLTGVPSSPSLDEVVLRRGSQRLMDRSRTVPREALTWPMELALRGIDVPHWVAVHGVDDVPPGVHRWTGSLDDPVTAGDLRDELERVALDQTLAADAAWVAIGATSLDALDDRSYRDAQLQAGVVEGRLHLAAYALGLGASGMTFHDSEVPALLGEGDDLATLLFTCVGVPEYASTPGGRPGAPVEVRGVVPRFKDA